MWEIASSQSRGHRDQQEDSVAIFRDQKRNRRRFLLVLADGAGGHGGGAEASAAVLEAAHSLWQKSTGSPTDSRKLLSDLADLAHGRIQRLSRGDSNGSAPRSTVVAVLCDGDRAVWMHVGDSRLYLVREQSVVKRTRDHSVVQLLVDRGSISYSDLRGHPDRSRLTQALGGDSRPTPDFDEMTLQEGDALVLCSDGFWEAISSQEVSSIVGTRQKLKQKLPQATATAVERVANCDNTSVVMARWTAALERRTVAAIFGITALTLLAIGLVVLAVQTMNRNTVQAHLASVAPVEAQDQGIGPAAPTPTASTPGPDASAAPPAAINPSPSPAAPPATPPDIPDRSLPPEVEPGERNPPPIATPVEPPGAGDESNRYQKLAQPHQYARLINEVGMRLVCIDAGEFPDHSEAGTPQPVQITKPFWIGMTEVTRAQYRAVVSEDYNGTVNDDLPVTDISFDEANRFCIELTQREQVRSSLPKNFLYTIPDEDEWQYACRAGDKRESPTLETLERIGWLRDTMPSSMRELQPVAMLDPNLWIVHDMFGNAGEWCSGRDGASRKIMGGNVTTPTNEVGYYNLTPASRESGDPLTGFRIILKAGALSN